MRTRFKTFIFTALFFFINFIATGCSTIDKAGAIVPNFLEDMSFAYQQDIQQGNVITQSQINRLLPSMSKQQVRYLLGTPMLVDTFHQNRWDFIYYFKERRKDPIKRIFSVFFDDNKLIKLTGDYAPQDKDEATEIKKNELVVSVPDYIPPNRGFIIRLLAFMGIIIDES